MAITHQRTTNEDVWRQANPTFTPAPAVPTLRAESAYDAAFPSHAQGLALAPPNIQAVVRRAATRLGIRPDALNPEQARQALVRASNLEIGAERVNGRAVDILVEEIATVAEAHARYVQSLGPDLRRGGSVRDGKIISRPQLVAKKQQLGDASHLTNLFASSSS